MVDKKSSKKNNKPLVIVGRAGVDLYARDHNTDLKKVTGFDRYVGGAGANIAVQAARLAKNSVLLTRLAKDPFGDYIKDYLKSNGVSVPTVPAEGSARNSLAITEIKKSSAVLFYRQDPADHHLSPSDIKPTLFSDALGVIITGTTLSHTTSKEAIDMLLYQAENLSLPVVLDIDYRPGFTSPSEAFLRYRSVIEKTDILIGTEEEYEKVTEFLKKSNQDREITNLLKSEEGLAEFFLTRFTMVRQPKVVIIKRGEHGSTAYFKKKNKIEKVQGGLFPIKLVKNFGAGDAFAATFCHYFLNKNSITKNDLSLCLKRASAAAAIVVSKGSCTEAMPSEDELLEFIKTNSYIV